MHIIKTARMIDHDRRRLFGTTALTVAAAQLGMIGSAKAQAEQAKHRLIKGGVGHNRPQEAPQAFAEAIMDVARG